MFATLLAITLALPLVLSLFVANAVLAPAASMFGRLLGDTDGMPWARVLQVVLVLGGTVGGVPIYDLERIAGLSGARTMPLTQNRWVMTIYESVLGTADALASALTGVLCIAIIAYAVRRRREPVATTVSDSPSAALPLAADGA